MYRQDTREDLRKKKHRINSIGRAIRKIEIRPPKMVLFIKFQAERVEGSV
jgi:hypothetical protein